MGIQVPPDSTGKVVETNSPDGLTQRQVVTIGDKSTALNVLGITAGGAAKVDGSAVTQPVSGTVTSNQGTANTPANSWSVEVTDGTNVLGTSAHPVRTDPTGTTIQPVSGTVTSNIGTTNGLALDATVANPQATSGGTTAPTKIQIIGGKTTDVTPQFQPVPLTNSGAAVKVDGSAVTQPISGSVTANAGTGTFVTQEGTTLSVTLQRISTNPASSGDNTIIAAQGVGKQIYVYAYSLSFSGTVNAKFTDGAAGTQKAFHYGIANSGGGEAVKPPTYLWVGTANTALILNLSGATAVACNVSYFVI